MGYTHYFEIDRALTAEEFEIVGADARAIVKTAGDLGIALCGDAPFEGYAGFDEVVINSNEIMLNGVGDESAESLHVTREPQADAYNPPFNCCKTYRRNYSPVVEAVLMALKQAAPTSVLVGSNGSWGFEWLHGSHCVGVSGENREECLNVDPGHVGLGGRDLYSMAFPSSPEPMYVFESPLKGTEYENRPVHMPRDLDCKRRGSGFEGLPFGVTLRWLLDQARRNPRTVCTLCGEPTETRGHEYRGLVQLEHAAVQLLPVRAGSERKAAATFSATPSVETARLAATRNKLEKERANANL